MARPITAGGGARRAPPSSSWPVSSPSRTTTRRPSSAISVQAELARALLHGGDNERGVLVEVHAQLLGALVHLVAVHRRGEAGLLELLLHRLRLHAVDPGG